MKLSNFSHARSGHRGSFNEELEHFDPLHYPPELFGPARVEAHARDDSALDVWLLGIVLYRMLTVSHPFLVRGFQGPNTFDEHTPKQAYIACKRLSVSLQVFH